MYIWFDIPVFNRMRYNNIEIPNFGAVIRGLQSARTISIIILYEKYLIICTISGRGRPLWLGKGETCPLGKYYNNVNCFKSMQKLLIFVKNIKYYYMVVFKNLESVTVQFKSLDCLIQSPVYLLIDMTISYTFKP